MLLFLMHLPIVSAILAGVGTFLVVTKVFDADEVKQEFGKEISLFLCVLLYLLLFTCSLFVLSIIETAIFYMR